jgi:lysophospholipase L1-like esterase
VRATGARLGVVLRPRGSRSTADARAARRLRTRVAAASLGLQYPYRRLGDLLAAENVPWTSLARAPRAPRRDGTVGYYEWDGHWDADGHAAVAEALAPFVEALVRE